MLARFIQRSSRKTKKIKRLRRIKLAIKKSPLTARNKAKIIAELASDKKAENIVLLDMRKVANFCDYFVVVSATSARQVRAIAQGIEEGLQEIGIRIRYKEGFDSCLWVLLDMGDVVVHVFESQSREFYGLEHLWQDASRISWTKSKSSKKFKE